MLVFIGCGRAGDEHPHKHTLADITPCILSFSPIRPQPQEGEGGGRGQEGQEAGQGQGRQGACGMVWWGGAGLVVLGRCV